MQYVDFYCKKQRENTYRVENKKQCHPVLSVNKKTEKIRALLIQ